MEKLSKISNGVKSVLVIFGKNLPKKEKSWFKQFDKVIGPKELDELTDSGSVQEAYDLVNRVSRMTFSDGSRVSKMINYQGYELWWMHYDDIYYDFCLSYTQYRRLLFYLKDFEKVYLSQPPCHPLFQYFFIAHHRQCVILNDFKLRNLLPIPFGIFIQFLLSVIFLLWLKITRPKLMVWTSDRFDPPHQCDFRMTFIYEELRKRKIPFVEFIRSIESWSTVLNRASRRKRPVFYSTAVIFLISCIGSFFNKKQQKRLTEISQSKNPEKHFWLQIATHYLQNIKGSIWSIQAMKLILQWIGVKAAIVTDGCNRTFHEVLGCKLAGIKTVGIQHGATPKHYFVSDFMPNFDGDKKISVDEYGLWSDWWKNYYLKNSRAYKPDQLYVSGPMRPLKGSERTEEDFKQKKSPLKVLFISEQVAVPKEVMPYLLTLLEVKDFKLYFKFRPHRDGFEEWLKEKQPEVYKKALERAKILRETIEEAISLCDVVVGSYSNAVLEALLQLKPLVFFRTQKWGDYFEIKSLDAQGYFFAENPEELIEKIKKSTNILKEDLKKLQKQFFGNPYQNGSKWVVDQVINNLLSKPGFK